MVLRMALLRSTTNNCKVAADTPCYERQRRYCTFRCEHTASRKNGLVSATKLGTTNNFFVAATKNFAAATKRFVD